MLVCVSSESTVGICHARSVDADAFYGGTIGGVKAVLLQVGRPVSYHRC